MRSDVEEAANQAIRSDLGVSATYMPLATAREIGALALFGEMYGEVVRVVDMGGPLVARAVRRHPRRSTPPRSAWSR